MSKERNTYGKRPAKDTYKRKKTNENRPTKETYKGDLRKRPTTKRITRRL